MILLKQRLRQIEQTLCPTIYDARNVLYWRSVRRRRRRRREEEEEEEERYLPVHLMHWWIMRWFTVKQKHVRRRRRKRRRRKRRSYAFLGKYASYRRFTRILPIAIEKEWWEEGGGGGRKEGGGEEEEERRRNELPLTNWISAGDHPSGKAINDFNDAFNIVSWT